MTMMKKATKVMSPLRVGNQVFVRSVTHYYTGRIVLLTKDEIVLEDACWIACTARMAEWLKTGAPNCGGYEAEYEPFAGPVSLGRGAVIDVTDWPHALPREQR